MKRNRRSKKSNRVFTTLTAVLLAVSMMGSTISAAVAAETSEGSGAASEQAVEYTAPVITDIEAVEASGGEYGEDQGLSAGESGSDYSGSGLGDGEGDDGAQAGSDGSGQGYGMGSDEGYVDGSGAVYGDGSEGGYGDGSEGGYGDGSESGYDDGTDELYGDGSGEYGPVGGSGDGLFGEEGSGMESGLTEEAAAGDEAGEDGLQEYAETIDEDDEDVLEEAGESEYTFVAAYKGGAWQAGSGEELTAEDFSVFVYDEDENLIDTIDAESVTSDYEVDEDGCILALVVCVYEGETITVEAKIMTIRTLAGEDAAFAVYSATDGSLTFYYGEVPEEGGEYNEKAVTAVFTGVEDTSYNESEASPFVSVAEDVVSVTFDSSFSTVQPARTSYWFADFESCTGINGLGYLDTSAATSIDSMFKNCKSITSLDLSCLDVSSVTQMRGVFSHCESLTYLNVYGWDVTKVTTMRNIFEYCSGLTSLDITSWNTGGVEAMSGMFRFCTGLSTIDLSNFSTASATTLAKMFNGCSGLTSLNVTGFDTSKCTEMYDMFAGCESLTSLNLSSFDTSKVLKDDEGEDANANYKDFLVNCTSLQLITITEKFDLFSKSTAALISEKTWYEQGTENMVSDNHMIGFLGSGTYETHEAEFSVFAVYSGDDNSLTFYADEAGRPSKGSTYKDKTVTDVFVGFEDMRYDADYVPWHTYRENVQKVVTDASFAGVDPISAAYWFFDFANCTSFDLTYLDTSLETDMTEMFYGCSSITELDLNGFDTSNVTAMERMFEGCTSLQSLDISSFDTANVTSYTGFLADCDELRSITISDTFDLFEKSEEALVDEQKWYDKNTYTLVSDNYMIGFKGTGTYEAHEEDITIFAVYSEDDHSLTFYQDEGGRPEKGTDYNGRTVTEVYIGFDGLRYGEPEDVPWHAHSGDVLTVEVDGSFADVTPVSTANWFYNFSKCTSFNLANLNTSNVTDMQSMFYKCSSVKVLDLSSFDTSNVTTTHCMFRDCTSMTFVDVSSFDTGSMTDMSQMFHTCKSLTELDLSHFDTSSLGTMANMFNGCESLETLNLRGWNTENTDRMASEFYECYNLKTVYINEGDFDLSHHDLKNDTNMFLDCYSIVGGNGTTYDPDQIHHDMAVIDSVGNPGYFTDYTFFAVYSEDDDSLTFYSAREVPDTGEIYEGKTATYVYTGIINTGEEAPPWESVKAEISTVSCDSSIESFSPKSFYNWFSGMESCTSIDLTWLNTTDATVYDDMMTGMEALETLTIGDYFDLFTRSSAALVSQQNWYDADGNTESDDYMIGISEAGTYYTDPCTSTHHYGEPVFTWEDDYSACWATFTCEYGDSVITLECDITKEIIGSDTVYTASCELDGTIYTDEQSETELFNGDGTFKVVITWDDEADNDGIRPTEVLIKLTKGNATEGSEITLTEADADDEGNWVGTFTGLPKYENGEEIAYLVKEDYTSGYTYRVELKTDDEGKSYAQLTNVHVTVKENIDITKIWDDADDQDGKRPDSITVRLLVNGNLYKERTLTADTEGVTVSDNGDVWEYTMTDIPVDKNGEAIEYTMLEVDMDNYGTPVIETIRGDEITDNGVTYRPYSFVVTNSHTPEQVTVSGTKVWEDASDQDGKRPSYVELDLLADGEVVERIDVSTGDAMENDPDVWTWTFSAHDKYKNGNEIKYTVEEAEAAGYETIITGSAEEGFTITNSYTPETTTISGSKTWVDDDNADNTRPESITVRLHANGNEKVYEQTVTADDGWAWEFTDVPVYSNGKHIDYTLTEDAVDDYDAAYTFGDDGSLNVTNTLSPGNTSLTVEKDWEDSDDQDGIRPENVTVELVKEGVATGDTLTLSDENHWTDTFHNLQEYEGGVRINYMVREVSAEGYQSDISGDAKTGYTITNTHTPETISVSGSKLWEDNDDQDGIRPDNVTIHLLADGEAVESHTVTAEDNWEWTFEGLDRYAAGEEIEYTMEEVFVADGYEVDPGTAENDFTFTNTHEPEVIDITGTKTWDDDDDRDGIRPAGITVSLYADGRAVTGEDGSPVSASVTPDADGSWTYTFSGYDKCADGEEIDYSIREEVPEGYRASYSYSGYDVTNSHSPELFNGDGTLSVVMSWDDENDQDGLRPKSVEITLTSDSADEDITLVISDDNVDGDGSWIGSFTDLCKYADGEEITYSVGEVLVNGYICSAELLYDEDTCRWYVEITNTHDIVTSDITVTKVWDDSGDRDGIRPDGIELNLFSNGSAAGSVTLTQDKEGVSVSDDGSRWSYTFENMPVSQNGEPVIYSIEEADTDNYSYSVDTTTTAKVIDYDGYEFSYTEYDFTVTNSHTPETTVVSGEKVWDDADDQDGMRPHSITIALLADGEPAVDESGAEITLLVTPHTDGSWVWTFTDIPKYRDGGEEIVYSFKEDAVEGYETSYSADGRTVTNTHEPLTTGISGSKVWDDENDQDGLRPGSIDINLFANGILLDTKTVTAADGWAWTFEDLPEYENGKKISYVITETAVDNYDASYSGYNVTNTCEPGKTSVTVIADWEDADDQDGIRPTSIMIELFADGDPALDENGNAVTLTLTEDENGIWEGSFLHLDENKDGGTRIEYTIGEVIVDGYECAVEGDASIGYSLTFTHTPETIDISVSKNWDDADDQDGLRPDQITVHLSADGEEILTEEVTPTAAGPLRRVAAIMTMGTVISAEADWSFEFTDLPKYAGGQEITYTISEAAVNGYGTSITGDAENGFEIRNTHIPETVTVSGTKVWHDSDDQDGLRPESIVVNLKADGKDVQSLEVTGNGGTWEWAFSDLPKYANGEAIEYTVDETAVDGYDAAVTGGAESGYTIINTHTPETVTISGSKTWDDGNNQDGLRPSSVMIRLHRNGEVIAARTVTAYDGWSWTFSNEPKYENGQEIVYTITEDAVDDYSTSVEGYDVTNSCTPGQTSLTVLKDWEDAGDQDGRRPTEITVRLLADGEETDETLTLSEANGWEDTFTELDEYSEGIRIEYTVEEDAVDEYDCEITGSAAEGFVVTNTHEPETVEISVNKIWDDADDQDGKRPESIIVDLVDKNGKTVAVQTVTEEDGWACTFTPDRYAGGKEIDYSGYSVEEAAVIDYETEICGSVEDGFEITNTHEPETINSDTHVLAVYLRWNDDDNTDGLRPLRVTLTLMANGEAVLGEDGLPVTLVLDGSEVDGEGNWVGEFDLTGIDLYRYRDGLEISYTADETDENGEELTLDGYTSRTALVYDGETGTWHLEVTNSHMTVTQNITVTKIWDDDSNRDGKRPESISIYLMANGDMASGGYVTLTKDNVTVSDDGNTWTYVYEDMAVDENGKAVEYTLDEGSVSKYENRVETVRGEEITESGVTYEPYFFTITNTHEIETVDISGTIIWDDDNNKADSRPDSVTVHLYADGVEIATTEATAANGWTWSFTDLPKYADGKEIVYTVTEDSVYGYDIEITGDGEHGFVITDTLESVKDDEGGGDGGDGGDGGNGGNGGGNGGNGGNGGGNGGNGGNGGSGNGGNGGSGSGHTGIIGGHTGDTNVVPILLIIIFIAVAAVVVVLVWWMTGRRIRR